jgi:hypothetical protein
LSNQKNVRRGPPSNHILLSLDFPHVISFLPVFASLHQKVVAFASIESGLARLPLPDRVVKALTLAGALDGLDEYEWGLIQEVC